jgi:hypothetical protein
MDVWIFCINGLFLIQVTGSLTSSAVIMAAFSCWINVAV